LACTLCHINNVFAGTPTDCYSCHKADYTGTNNPAHVAAGFPTTCATCHTTTAWTGATFNHTWFPITSGNHNQPCAVCHINAADYTVFSCDATCHAKATTDRNHSGVKNYIWNATSCYGCHPTGRAG
jgi:predicted CXXCH cytochrome family protein